MTPAQSSATLAGMPFCNFPRFFLHFFMLPGPLLLGACGDVWNDPYPAAERGQNILYSAFTERP